MTVCHLFTDICMYPSGCTILGNALSKFGRISFKIHFYSGSNSFSNQDMVVIDIVFYLSAIAAGHQSHCPLPSPYHRSFHPITPFGTYLPDFKPGAQNIVGVRRCRFQWERRGMWPSIVLSNVNQLGFKLHHKARLKMPLQNLPSGMLF